MIHWIREDGTYLCNGAYFSNPKKIAKFTSEVTCKNCIRKIRKLGIGDELF